MEEEATPKTERSSAASSSQNLPGDANEILVPSFSPPASPTPTGTGTLTRLGMSLRAQAAGGARGAAGGAAGGPGGGQVSAITVVSVQENQQRMEQRQAELEGAVRTVQGDVTRLSKVHLNTANNVNKLLERSRKVGGGVKEVKERLDKQAVQVKRLENNHAHLLKRNHFKVVITQEDNEIPTDVFVRDSMKTPLPPFDEEGSVSGSMAGSMCLQNVSLTSDEDDDQATHRELLAEIDRRADRFKRNSLKKVDSLKKAFTRQNIEKKVNQITTKIVPPEKREKIIKSFSPNHPKSPTAKNSSFKVTPMTFNVKKVRDLIFHFLFSIFHSFRITIRSRYRLSKFRCHSYRENKIRYAVGPGTGLKEATHDTNDVRQASTLTMFKSRLKTALFTRAYEN
uniref:Uncharacterized protein n=1 Tax=Neogobius melanostomus TaxID=47308 RepID=A0A8C6SE08_9GOBI